MEEGPLCPGPNIPRSRELLWCPARAGIYQQPVPCPALDCCRARAVGYRDRRGYPPIPERIMMIADLPLGWLAPLVILVAALLPRLLGRDTRPNRATGRSLARPAKRSGDRAVDSALSTAERSINNSAERDRAVIDSIDDPIDAAREARRIRNHGTD